MSRAFVKEQETVEVPERPISPHRNLVTPAGLAQIDGTIAALRAQLAEASAENRGEAVAIASRDLRYWTARRASAEVVALEPGDTVRFGSTVMLERADGRRQSFRIVGEDEADPAQGRLAYVAPLARAVTGKVPGEEIDFRGETILVAAID